MTASATPATLNDMGLRSFLRPHRQPVAEVSPDPLRTPDDAHETGLIIGATGNQSTPWIGIAIKNLKDRGIATGGATEQVSRRSRRAGTAGGRQAGTPP